MNLSSKKTVDNVLSKTQGKRCENGFSLLEALVAFAILSLSLSVLFQIFSSGSRNISLSRDYNNAVIIAQTQLALLDEEKKIEVGEKGGSTEQGVNWQRLITEYPDPDPSPFNQNYPLVNVEISVNWKTLGRDYNFSLTTKRIAGMK